MRVGLQTRLLHPCADWTVLMNVPPQMSIMSFERIGPFNTSPSWNWMRLQAEPPFDGLAVKSAFWYTFVQDSPVMSGSPDSKSVQ